MCSERKRNQYETYTKSNETYTKHMRNTHVILDHDAAICMRGATDFQNSEIVQEGSESPNDRSKTPKMASRRPKKPPRRPEKLPKRAPRGKNL